MKLDNRIWLLLTGVVAVAILAAAWFVGAQPFLAGAADLDSQRQTVDGQNASTRTELVQLAAAKRDQDAISAKAAKLRESVPFTLGGSALIRSINAMADSTGVKVTAVTIGAATPYAAPAVAAPAAAASGSAPSASASPSASPSASASAAAAPSVPTGPAPYANGLITAANFVVVPISVEVSGDYDNVLAFTHALQTGPRLVLVSGVNIGSGDTGGFDGTLTGNVYVLSEAAAAGASANG